MIEVEKKNMYTGGIYRIADEKNPYYEIDNYEYCFINKDNKIIIELAEWEIEDLSDFYFYEIYHTDNQEDWHFNVTVKHHNKILFNDEVTVKFDKQNNQAYFVTKDNKTFTLDCISEYKETRLLPSGKHRIKLEDNYTICYTETPFKLIDMK